MQRLLFLTFLISLILSGCDNVPPRTIKPYNPEKAGATIVESFDITGQLRISGRPTAITDSLLIPSSYDVAEYNDAIYINNNKVVYAFDKNTFTKINEIKLNNLQGSNVHGFGFVITSDGHSFIISRSSSPMAGKFFSSLNLTTGEATRIRDFSINGEDFVNSNVEKMGYNKTDDTVWFMTYQNYKPFFSFYRYDAENESFVFLEQKEGPQYSFRSSSIYGNLYFDSSYTQDHEGIDNIGINIYNLDNHSEKLHFIDVEYLNTLTLPQSALYDGEHIWLMVERNKRLLMLKLLPHW